MSDLDLYRNFGQYDPLSFTENLLSLPPISDGALSLHNETETVSIDVPPILLPPASDEEHYLFVGGY